MEQNNAMTVTSYIVFSALFSNIQEVLRVSMLYVNLLLNFLIYVMVYSNTYPT